MKQFPIGAMLESFRLGTKEAIEKAAQLGVQGLQMYATQGEHAPENMTPAARRELLDMVKSNGLEFSAICGDFGHGFGNPEKNSQLIEPSKRVMDLACDLETNIVTTHIGVVPADPAHPRYAIMQEACGILSEYADSMQSHFAIETGPETASVLKPFLDGLHSKGVAVNLDPANLVMVTGDDPVQAVHTLGDYIVHTHAKDGRKLLDKDPEIIYGLVEEEIKTGRAFVELPLGEGDVPFPAYLAALEEIGYEGYLTIEREVGDQPVVDIQTAVNYLKQLTGRQ